MSESLVDDAVMQSKRVRVVLATSHPIAAYGGVQFSEDAIQGIAEAFASGSAPMRFSHDLTRPVQFQNIDSGTERLADGNLAAWAEFDVDSGIWDAYQREVAEAGAPGGMSISVTTPLPGESNLAASPVLIAADAHHFTDEEIRGAVLALTRIEPSAQGRQLLQFAIDPQALVAIEVAASLIATVGVNVASNAIYDAVKRFFSQRRRGNSHTVVDLQFKADSEGPTALSVRIDAEDIDQVRNAMAELPRLLESAQTGIYSSTNGQPLEAVDAQEEVSPETASGSAAGEPYDAQEPYP